MATWFSKDLTKAVSLKTKQTKKKKKKKKINYKLGHDPLYHIWLWRFQADSNNVLREVTMGVKEFTFTPRGKSEEGSVSKYAWAFRVHAHTHAHMHTDIKTKQNKTKNTIKVKLQVK